jgi:hypothetical protein
MSIEAERRRYPRLRPATEVHCELLGSDELFIIRDVSAGGAFIETPEPLPAASDVKVSFHLRPDDPLVNCSGRVVYSLEGVGMGIEFHDVTGALGRAVRKFLDDAN